MRIFYRLTVLLLILSFSIIACGCSTRKKVDIISNNPPETKKPISGNNVTTPPEIAKDIKVSFGDTTMEIYSAESSITITYDKIEEYMFMSEWNYASDKKTTTFTDNEYVLCSQMETAEQEKYTLFIFKTVNKYISVYYRGQLVVFNLSSVEDTQECYNKLKEKMG